METIRIRDPGWKKVGSRIRDKHAGSATLPFTRLYDLCITFLPSGKTQGLDIDGFLIGAAHCRGIFRAALWGLA
jgi:hypothetical protein